MRISLIQIIAYIFLFICATFIGKCIYILTTHDKICKNCMSIKNIKTCRKCGKPFED